MNRGLYVLTVLFVLSGRGYGQDTLPHHMISVGGAYSYQTFLDVGQDFTGRYFDKTRSGLLFNVGYDYGKDFFLHLDVGMRYDYHKRDSITLSCGSFNCVEGYEMTKYNYLRYQLLTGVVINRNSKYFWNISGGIGASNMIHHNSWSYEYENNEIHSPKDSGSSWYIRGIVYHIAFRSSFVYKLTEKRCIGMFIEFQRPLNELEKDFISFTRYNLGVQFWFRKLSK